MMENDKRRHTRINSLNLSYVLIDENNEVVRQSMGRTLNVSETGILLETHFPIDTRYLVLLSVGLENNLIDIKGEVIYSRPGQKERFETGINFLEIDEPASQVLKAFIKAFQEHKDSRQDT